MRRRRRGFEQNCKDILYQKTLSLFFGSREIVVHHKITFASIVLLKNSAAALQHHLCLSHKPTKKQPTLKNTEKQKQRECVREREREAVKTKGRSLHTVQAHARDTKALKKRAYKNSISTNPFQPLLSFHSLFQLLTEKNERENLCFQTPPLPEPPSSILACLHCSHPLIGHLCFVKERREGRVKGARSKIHRQRLLLNKTSSRHPPFQNFNNNIPRL